MKRGLVFAALITACGGGGSGDAGGAAGTGDGGSRVDGGPERDGGREGALDAGDCPAMPAYSLIKNGGFECTSLANAAVWKVLGGTGRYVQPDAAHSGLRALALTRAGAAEAILGQDRVVLETATMTYCAQVWARGSVPEMRFEVRASPSGKATAFSSPLASDGGWVKVPPGEVMRVTNALGETLSVVARSQNSAEGQTLVVDDFELWPSPSGLCAEH